MSTVPVSTKARHRGKGKESKQKINKEDKLGDNGGITDDKKLTFALQQAKEEALASGMSQEEFKECVLKASKQLKLHPLDDDGEKPTHGKRSCYNCVCVFKVLWLMFLLLLAVALMSAAFKPVMFFMHKMLHEHMYYITRPIRLSMVSILPYFKMVGFDFLHQDCLIENPFLGEDERCPCSSVKYPTEFIMNDTYTQLPEALLQPPLREVIVVRNGTSLPSDFSLDKIIRFSESHGTPKTCMEFTVEGVEGLKFYNDLFNSKKMKKFLKEADPWTYSWEECPDKRALSTLRSLFPSPSPFLPPNLKPSTNSIFTLTTQWAPSSYYQEGFEERRLILLTVLLGELRVMPEAKMDSPCMDVCTGFKDKPVLQQGDSVIFDQQFWSYQATTWSKIGLTNYLALS